MKKLLGLSVVLMIAPLAHAADVEAGKAKVATVCAACHGASGVSVSDTIPNLAAQRAGYLEAQLKALKDGTRKNPIMNAIAAQLSAEDIANVAAYFSAQPGALVADPADGFRFARFDLEGDAIDGNEVAVSLAQAGDADGAGAGDEVGAGGHRGQGHRPSMAGISPSA